MNFDESEPVEPDATSAYFETLGRVGNADRERRLAVVSTIQSIRDIPDADNIVCARVRGWDVVVKRGEFEAGDECIYFEIDSMLPESDERFAFLMERGVRTDASGGSGHVLKTARLRGQYSQGLAMPVALFRDERLACLVNPDCADLTDALGIVKWDPPIPADLLGKVRGMRPSWISKTGADRAQNRPDVFTGDDSLGEWVATEKIDGESMTIWWTKEGPTVGHSDYGVCTRGVDLDMERRSPMVALAMDMQMSILLDFLGKTLGARTIAISGEFHGEGVKGNPLRRNGQHFSVFRAVVDSKNLPLWGDGGLADLSDVFAGLLVPYHDLPFPGTSDEAVAQVEGLKSVLNPQRNAEGIVWRQDTTGQVVKVINNKYLLKNDR